jgi:hypothetical protein
VNPEGLHVALDRVLENSTHEVPFILQEVPASHQAAVVLRRQAEV